MSDTWTTDPAPRLHESRERIVRRSVTELVPKLAAFSPQRFSESYLSASAALLLATIRQGHRRHCFKGASHHQRLNV